MEPLVFGWMNRDRKRQTDGQADRQRQRETDRDTERHTETQTDRDTDRQTETQTDRDRVAGWSSSGRSGERNRDCFYISTTDALSRCYYIKPSASRIKALIDASGCGF